MLTLEQAVWVKDFLGVDVDDLIDPASFQSSASSPATDQATSDDQLNQADANPPNDTPPNGTPPNGTPPNGTQQDAAPPDATPGGAPAAETTDADPSPATSAAPGGEATAPDALAVTGDADKVGLVPVVPVIVVLAKTLVSELTATVSITNNTKFELTLDNSSLKLESGEFKSGRPKGLLKVGDPPTTFVANSKPLLDVPILKNLSIGGVEGTIRYFVGDQKTVLSCHFNNPRFITDPLGTNAAEATIVGPNAALLQQPTATKTNGAEAVFTFTLDGKGGDGPTPSNGGGVTASCRVSVVNQTQQTVFLRKQDNAAGGDFVTNPATSLAPGATTQFVYAETPNSNNHNCRGTMSWDIGDPKLGVWSMMWDNQKGAKNLSASFLAPDDGTFHTLDQIDQGDENVPVTFTLSGGGGAKPAGKPTSCAILVKNATSGVLTLTGSQAESGAFQTTPPATIAAGNSALVTFAGAPDNPAKGAKGSMQWDVGDPKAAAWTTSWNNPPGEKNTVDGKLDPASAGFKSDATTADGDDDVAMSFTVSGGTAPVPVVDDEFAPPPKSKQPTLRKGDESPDGWIEYAQRLLNKNKLNVTVNGKFDSAMEAKVKTFQKNNECQADGVIGNETWSKLREGPKEAVGTDGRQPHSFEQKNAQARFVTERADVTGYDASDDSYFMFVVSTGEQPIDEFQATLKVTQPDNTSHTHKFKIGAATSPSPDGQGNFHRVDVQKFKQVFGLKQGVDPLDCSMDAYLDKDIGGDRLTGPIVKAP